MKAILFDLDGTLIDSHQDLAVAVNAALAEVGLPQRSVAQIRGFIGEGSRQLMRQAVAPHEELLEPAHRAWERAYGEALLVHTTLYPGVRALLDQLQGRAAEVSLAVHTNKPGRFARPILDGLGVFGHFRRILGDGDDSPRKPDPAGALKLLVELNSTPDQAAYIGDSRTDLGTADAAGIPFLGVGWGFGRAGLDSAGATVAETVEALALELRARLG